MALSAGQLPREMYSRLMPLTNGVCESCLESNGTTMCGLWNDDTRRTTRQPHHSAIVQTQHFSLFGHIARMLDETKQIPRRS